MDLREFIKTTIVQIIGGVNDARFEIENGLPLNAYVAPVMSAKERNEPTAVSFDVAVTATESSDGAAKAGIRVWALELSAGGGVKAGTESVSRIRFEVPIVLPGAEPKEDKRARLKAAEDLAAKRADEDARIAAARERDNRSRI